MRIFRGRKDDRRTRRPPMIEEIEGWARRILYVPLAIPVFLALGLWVGKATSASLDLPERTMARSSGVSGIDFGVLGDAMRVLRENGVWTGEYVRLYRDHIRPVEKALIRRGVPKTTAREIAWPLVQHTYAQGLDLATVLAVVMIESRGRPDATSPVGARGLMQVMPDWEGHWPGCGSDLYDIESNLCHGTEILAWYLRINDGNERQALLGYNGCIRGTFTPDCWRYPDKVDRIRERILREWGSRRVAVLDRP